jgi:regulator of replication initiation timing
MSLNFLVRGKVDQLPQPQPDAEPKQPQALAPPSTTGPVPAPASSRVMPRGRIGDSSSAPPFHAGETKMTDDLQAIANLIGQLSDDPPEPTPIKAPAAVAAAVAEAPRKTADDTSAREDSLFDEYQATLARLEASKSSGEGLLSQIEAFSNTLERQVTELSMARASMNKLATDNSRLVNENDRLRAMLRSLLEAIDADARRSSESIAAAERRLRDLSRQPQGGERDRQKQGPVRGLVAEG